MTLYCSVCWLVGGRRPQLATLIIEGYGVCQDHIDTIGRSENAERALMEAEEAMSIEDRQPKWSKVKRDR